MKKRILYIFLFLCMLASIGYLYLNNVFLSVKLKNILTQKIEYYTDHKASIDNIYFSFNKGLTIKNIKLYRKDFPSKEIVNVQEASASVLFAPLIKKKLILIPQITLSKVSLFIKKENKKEWNLTALIESTKKQIPKKIPETSKKIDFSFICKAIEIKEGTLTYVDSTLTEEYIETIENIYVHANISLLKKLSLSLKSKIQKHNSTINLNATYSLAKKDLSLKGSFQNIQMAQYLNLFLSPYARYMDQGILSSNGFSLDKENNHFIFKGNLESNKTIMRLPKSKKVLKGDFVLDNANIQINPNNTIQGNYRIRAQKTSVTLPNSIHLSGDLNAEIRAMSIAPNSVHLEGDFQTNKTYGSLLENIQFSGNILGKNTLFDFSPQKLIVKGELHLLESRILHLFPEKCVGDLILPNYSLQISDGNFTLESPLQLKNIKVQFDSKKYLSGDFQSQKTQIKKENAVIKLSTDLIANNVHAQINKTQTLKGNGTIQHAESIFEKEKIHISLKGIIENADIDYPPYHFTGSPDISIKTTYQLPLKSFSNYEGSIHLNNVELEGVPSIQALQNASGLISFNDQGLSTDEFTFTADNMDYALSGTLLNFSHPTINMRLTSNNIDLEKITEFIPESIKKKFDFNLSGKAKTNAHYQGSIHNPLLAKISVNTILSQGGIQSKTIPELSSLKDIAGKITYTNDQLTWEDLTLTRKGKTYTLTGTLENYNNPHVTTSLQTQKMKANTSFEVFPEYISIKVLNASYLNSAINAQGTVFLSDAQNPQLDINNTFTIELEDFESLVIQKTQLPIEYYPRATFSGKSQIKGFLKNILDYEVSLKAQSHKVLLSSYALTNNYLEYTLTKRKSKIHYNTHIFDGALSLHAASKMFDKKIPFSASLAVNDLNLLTYRKEKNLKTSQLSGKLGLQLSMEGEAKNIYDAQGSGHFTVKDGLLGEIAIVEGLVSAINNVPGFLGTILSNVSTTIPTKASTSTKNYITEAVGDFIIKDQRVLTNNTTLFGSIYDLKIQGVLNRDQSINALVYPNYSRFTNQNRAATEILGSPVHLKISGTLKNPHYDPIIDPAKPVENVVDTTIDIFKGVGSIFEDLF